MNARTIIETEAGSGLLRPRIVVDGCRLREAEDLDDLPDGRPVATAETGWLPVARDVAKNGWARIDTKTNKPVKRGGTVLDGFTASMLVKVYDALNDANKAKFAALPLLKAVSIGWKFVK